MTEGQRRHLEKRLLEERQRLVDSLARYRDEGDSSERERSGDLSAYPLHLADEGTDEMRRELDASIAQRESGTLADIDEALRRLYRDPERYGRCEVSGEEIPFARLDVIPWARTCEEHAGTRGR
ncbi:MAG TPA: TraR/DksA family transcriptional regulator [Gemmatimonadaceae bacterium]|nr:TraR/DksA family transcriptional regulator [Gemmatimonadaceae bacterium]